MKLTLKGGRYMIEVIEKRNGGIDIIRLSNDYLVVDVMNLGCTILKCKTKDKDGIMQDVVLGYEQPEEYLQYDGYLGAVVGRVANRIKHGKFVLNGIEYQLPINNGPNSLHGGNQGFDKRYFDYEIRNEQLVFHYLSKDMEEGYPGNVSLTVIYELQEDTLIISYSATTDKDTIINVSNHSYFNLDGEPTNIGEHEFRISAEKVAKIDAVVLATGEFLNVENTPFDFRTPTAIKEQIYKEHEQLRYALGIDHSFVFTQTENQVTLYSNKTGIELNISTNLPQAQVYSANYLDGRCGKQGLPMNEKSGLCVETQMMPNDINFNPNSNTILRKGERYESRTSYQFRVRT